MGLGRVAFYDYGDVALWFGTARADVIVTRKDRSDIVLGGGGNDRIIASAGGDSISGEGGNDVLVIRKGMRDDVDFEGGRGRDVVDLSWLDPRKDEVEFEPHGNDYMSIHYHGHEWLLMDVEAVKLKAGLMDI